ncbi:MAG: HD domain-containing protein [Desulfobacteraceae bacterium]|nr:HD domain-containing protein [Desulfobacteraceae bacterium]
MNEIVALLFQAHHLKRVKRTGYEFLGMGNESVAEHSYHTVFIAYALSKLVPEADALRLLAMCLFHDLTEARIGDLNYVQKKYVTPDESKALADTISGVPFGRDMAAIIEEFNAQETLEARLSHDADQLSFIMDLKMLSDLGYKPPKEWLPNVRGRLKTQVGIQLSDSICKTNHDQWWRKIFVDSENEKE